jgi:hypothetical protein
LVAVGKFASIVKIYNSFGQVMNFSTIFTFDATLAHEIGATDF